MSADKTYDDTAYAAELEKWYEAIEKEPGDFSHRHVMADWLEDQGRPGDSGAMRWMAREGKRPYKGEKGLFTWFNAETISDGLGDPSSDLPAAVYKRLEGGKEKANHRTYDTHAEAEGDFRAAWVKAVDGGWDKTIPEKKAKEPVAPAKTGDDADAEDDEGGEGE